MFRIAEEVGTPTSLPCFRSLLPEPRPPRRFLLPGHAYPGRAAGRTRTLFARSSPHQGPDDIRCEGREMRPLERSRRRDDVAPRGTDENRSTGGEPLRRSLIDRPHTPSRKREPGRPPSCDSRGAGAGDRGGHRPRGIGGGRDRHRARCGDDAFGLSRVRARLFRNLRISSGSGDPPSSAARAVIGRGRVLRASVLSQGGFGMAVGYAFHHGGPADAFAPRDVADRLAGEIRRRHPGVLFGPADPIPLPTPHLAGRPEVEKQRGGARLLSPGRSGPYQLRRPAAHHLLHVGRGAIRPRRDAG